MQTKSKIKVQSENIFPIIKKWLYSDHDIFARELVSNACDAITKFRKLAAVGEAAEKEGETYAVRIGVSAKKKTISFSDNGIGMTADELDKYINEVAFSGAEEFLSKYKGDGAGIIGHFGLGFYSAFMVAARVTVDTLSYCEGAKPVKWSCDGSVDVTTEEGTRTERGTTVTLFAADDDSKKFFDYFTLRETLKKYCAYLPIDIYLKDEDKKESKADKKNADKKEDDKEDAERQDRDGEKINKSPLWVKPPKDCTPEEYREFYREMFFDFKEPLFWIHLNVDYPFNLKGILYFPDADLRNVKNEGAIKLFNNQVYVADNIKDVIPEYLMLLKGCIDCPDMPLNVSRSFLQNDGYLAKIKAHITKKVAEKLKSLYASEPDNYKKYWKTINPFVKYGCMTDRDFYGKIKEAVIFKTAAPDEYCTLDDVLREKTVYYVNDKDAMSLYLEGFKDKKILLLDDLIDVHFIQFLEGENRDVKFARADSDADAFKAEDTDAADPKLAEELFKRALPDVNVQAGPLSSGAPCMLISGEQARRMEAMGRMYNYGADMPSFKDEKLFVNTAHAAIKRLIETPDDGTVKLLYGAARLANGSLKPEEAGELAKGIYAVIGK